MNVTGNISDEVRGAAHFFASRLMDGRVHRHVHVEIQIDVNLELAGVCECDDDSYKPKWFTIRINPAAHDHVLQCLAHELVHVSQYVSGRLFDKLGGVIQWEGVDYRGLVNYGRYGEPGQDDYPWEIEAYAKEYDLFEDWLAQEVLD